MQSTVTKRNNRADHMTGVGCTAKIYFQNQTKPNISNKLTNRMCPYCSWCPSRTTYPVQVGILDREKGTPGCPFPWRMGSWSVPCQKKQSGWKNWRKKGVKGHPLPGLDCKDRVRAQSHVSVSPMLGMYIRCLPTCWMGHSSFPPFSGSLTSPLATIQVPSRQLHTIV